MLFLVHDGVMGLFSLLISYCRPCVSCTYTPLPQTVMPLYPRLHIHEIFCILETSRLREPILALQVHPIIFRAGGSTYAQ
ncbi:hypothetical protein KP509_28G028900 [Ceratopteris richardii]|uniref:Secreted protein n=1 Tax=Ceratopteris richardii TaxID=49495 RepID=A0A8T2RAR6_CERRI|nr:hypothetical protein KP509_28G028900 [Ceratopteris richardii]